MSGGKSLSNMFFIEAPRLYRRGLFLFASAKRPAALSCGEASLCKYISGKPRRRRGKIKNTCLALALLTVFICGFVRPKEGRVYFKDNCFFVELAVKPEERFNGLMFRKSLAHDRGMLFIFENEAKWPFYMKNTLIPLDIIWINREEEIVDIKKNAIPCTEKRCPILRPDKEALYVLEVNAGMTDDLGFKVGDKLDLRFEP